MSTSPFISVSQFGAFVCHSLPDLGQDALPRSTHLFVFCAMADIMTDLFWGCDDDRDHLGLLFCSGDERKNT